MRAMKLPVWRTPRSSPAALLRRADALADGFSDDELAGLVRRRGLVRVQRGTYLRSPADLPLDVTVPHRLFVAATIAGPRRPGIVSHASAAALHGLPLWNVHLGRVHVLRRPPAGGSGSARVHLHVAQISDEEQTFVDSILATNPARTDVDVARTESFESAVVTADAGYWVSSTDA